MKFILLAWLALTLIGCGVWISEEYAAQAAEKQGYRDISISAKHIVFVDWRGCGKDDDAAFKATATNALGQRVNIIICAGLAV